MLDLTPGGAFMLLITLAATNAISEKEVRQDPEVLGPMRENQQAAFDIVEKFLKDHLYGDCAKCA